jgi:hypothetical protein
MSAIVNSRHSRAADNPRLAHVSDDTSSHELVMSCLFLILAGVTLGQISPYGLAHISANWFPPRIAGSSRGFTVNLYKLKWPIT